MNIKLSKFVTPRRMQISIIFAHASSFNYIIVFHMFATAYYGAFTIP